MCMGITLLRDEPGDVVDLSGGGKVDNVAVADIRFGEAVMASSPDANQVERVRPMPGVLGVPASRFLAEAAMDRLMALAYRCVYLSSLNQFHSSPSEDRLPNQIWGNGD